MLTVADIIPPNWRDVMAERGPCALGLDVATTAKKMSNPSGICLMQQVGLDYIARVVLRFKTSDPEVTEAVLRELCRLPHGLRVRKIHADASNERFFVAGLKARLAGVVPVVPVVNNETLIYKGEKMTWKQYLGNLVVNTCEDGHLLLPQAKWLEKDMRQVQRSGGSFEADVDAEGNHADAFDGIKLALAGLVRGHGSAEASAAPVGTLSAGGGGSPGPVRKLYNKLAGTAAAIVRRLC